MQELRSYAKVLEFDSDIKATNFLETVGVFKY